MLRLILMYSLLIPSIALYWYVKRLDKPNASIILKSLCTGIILLAAISKVHSIDMVDNNRIYALLIVAGLAMGLAGDVAICFNFIAGMLFFGIGHCFYIAAMLCVTKYALLSIPVFIILYTAVFVLYRKSKISLGSLFAPVVVYSLIITIMLSLAITLLPSIPSGVIVFVGALLFTLSDTMLAWITFTHDRKMNFISLNCYFIGQSLFAASILL